MSIKKRIEELKKEKNAILLAHYYVSDEVQEIADYVGDSFYLAQKATETDADIIVFCGVSFMGESAAILNPEKKILMPDHQADCAMAHMVDVEKIQEMKEQYDDLAVVCYINSTAEIKTYSDVCVTSSNAVKIVNKLSNKDIFFVPDKNLGGYVAEQIPDKNIILNDGYCPIHNRMSVESLKQIKELHPKAKFLVHPECKKELQKEADYIGSTAGIIAFAAKDDADEYIVGTEKGVLFELRKQNPEKTFYTLTCQQICTDMKYITLEKICKVLETEENQVKVNEEFQKKALKPLLRMLELAK